ncbi:MAG: hypothetical protein H6714_06400 [Myxococcales bacterium]|nr:hypothetical protein [Myxococcales bacterium]
MARSFANNSSAIARASSRARAVIASGPSWASRVPKALLTCANTLSRCRLRTSSSPRKNRNSR